MGYHYFMENFSHSVLMCLPHGRVCIVLYNLYVVGKYIFEYSTGAGNPQRLFTENETNPRMLSKEKAQRLGVTQVPSRRTSAASHHGYKDAFHDYVIKGTVAK